MCNSTLQQGRGEPPTKFSKKDGGVGGGKGGADRILIFRGGYWERGGDLFQGGYSFYIKNKLKSQIFNEKKLKNKKVFLCDN